ncbi:MAG: Mini-ribonuclease 3 [Bavariicoccus seileri]|uniref:Mini-ribonuclease 3 n=1 Tax=Bavariicoccus seileri TaxID=549685 RepID=UPI0003B6D799|nr:Mini-ribonuclease 3 [Bavariicoccus seileri]
MMKPALMNGLTLAFVGDAVYDKAIRIRLVEDGLTKPNQLHQTAVQYVSAKAQAYIIKQWLENDELTEEELTIFKRGRNSKSHSSAKNADIATYRIATGFEALMGYLSLIKDEKRLDELVAAAVQLIKEQIDSETIKQIDKSAE